MAQYLLFGCFCFVGFFVFGGSFVCSGLFVSPPITSWLIYWNVLEKANGKHKHKSQDAVNVMNDSRVEVHGKRAGLLSRLFYSFWQLLTHLPISTFCVGFGGIWLAFLSVKHEVWSLVKAQIPVSSTITPCPPAASHFTGRTKLSAMVTRRNSWNGTSRFI